MSTRAGIGYDVHRLQPGIPLWLGGVRVEHEAGLAGHSDGDVLVHAIVDAMLGAAGLGDIGLHFPSSDMRYRGASSLIFLSTVVDLLAAQGWQVANVDATIVAERPRLAPYVPSMRETIAQTAGISLSQVNIKCTTTDGLGFAGRGEGIGAMAVATVEAAE